jgi:hypothetical protein
MISSLIIFESSHNLPRPGTYTRQQRRELQIDSVGYVMMHSEGIMGERNKIVYVFL